MFITYSMPDGWGYLTKGLQSPKYADWIFNNQPIFKNGKYNPNRKQGLLIKNPEKFKNSKLYKGEENAKQNNRTLRIYGTNKASNRRT